MTRYFFAAPLGLLLALGSCATTAYVPETRADSVLVAAGFPAKIKAQTVIVQLGAPGATQTATVADNRKAGQRQGSAATAPQATASNASKRSGGPTWWVYLLAAVASAVGWEWLSSQVAPLKWLPWRARPG